MWKLHAYVAGSGKSDVVDRYKKGSEELRARFDVQMEYLCARERSEWRRPHASLLPRSGGYRDFCEVRFMAQRCQQRPIGYFGPAGNSFTFVVWAIEKGNKLQPATWHGTATSRRNEITGDHARHMKFELDSYHE